LLIERENTRGTLDSLIHPKRFYWLLLAAAAVQAAYFFPQLPAEVASRFGAEGEVLQTMSKSGFMMLHLGIIAVIAALFGGIPITELPNRLINVPNRDYWLSGDRREKTLEVLQCELLVICNATMLLLLIIFHWVLQANLMEESHLDPRFVWLPLGLYVGFTLVWVLRLMRRFSAREEGAEAA